MYRNLVLAAMAACVMFLFSACAHDAGTVRDAAVEKDLSYEGMVPVKVKSLDNVWIRQGVSLASFQQVMFQTAEIQYRPVEPFSHRLGRSANRTEFPISEASRERLQKMLSDTFVEELEKSNRFTLVREPGPGVLTVRVTMLDVVSNVPPDLAGRNDIYLSSVGEATLVIELMDSESNAILARAVDREAADFPGRELKKSLRASNWAEVQKVVQSWASILRSQLDNLAESLDGE